MRNPDRFLTQLWAMDRALVAAGWPAISPWWRNRIERFVRSGRRRWVLRVGRRGGKSSTLCRLAAAVALFGEWEVPPGDTAVIPFVSIDRSEASGRLRTIIEILSVLGVEHSERGETVSISVHGRPVMFRVATCSVRGTVGFTSVAVFGDEVARWHSKETAANPAKEVLGSLRPTMATQQSAFEVDSSSPWTTTDYHAELFDVGDDDHQCTDHAATWDANPTITELDTHQMEPDERTRLREYAAIPSSGIENDWFGDAACDPTFTDDAEFWKLMGIRLGMAPIFTIDPAFSNDYFGWGAVTSEPAENDNGRLTIVQESGGMRPEGDPRKQLLWVRDSVFVPALNKATGRGWTETASELIHVHTDQNEFYSLRDIARSVGINLLLVPWTGGEHERSKATKFRTVRSAMRAGEVRIRKDRRNGELYRQFRSVAGVLLPSGNERIEFKRTGAGHCDELSAVMMGLALALERPVVAARPVEVVRTEDNPRAWREQAVREVEKKRAQEWKRSPHAVLRRAMGR